METLNNTPFTLSVVVPSYNQAQFLGATLESLWSQNDPALQIVVVDGGSTDGSADIIRRHADRLAWWVSEPDRGQSHALNKGFARCTGQWLCWLNSDDLLLPGALRTLRAHIAREPQARWWIGGGHFIDERGRRTRDYRAPAGLREAAQLSDWRSHWFAQPSTFFARELFDAAGGQVREDLHYAMDLALWLRLLALAPPGLIDAELSGYRIHSAAKTGMLGVKAEMEIMRVLQDALGAERAMDRVACIAADRLEFEQKWRRLQTVVDPLARPYLRLKALWRALAGRGTGSGSGSGGPR